MGGLIALEVLLKGAVGVTGEGDDNGSEDCAGDTPEEGDSKD